MKKEVGKNNDTVDEGRRKPKGILKPLKPVDLLGPRRTRSGKILSPTVTNDIKVSEKVCDAPKPTKTVMLYTSGPVLS